MPFSKAKNPREVNKISIAYPVALHSSCAANAGFCFCLQISPAEVFINSAVQALLDCIAKSNLRMILIKSHDSSIQQYCTIRIYTRFQQTLDDQLVLFREFDFHAFWFVSSRPR